MKKVVFSIVAVLAMAFPLNADIVTAVSVFELGEAGATGTELDSVGANHMTLVPGGTHGIGAAAPGATGSTASFDADGSSRFEVSNYILAAGDNIPNGDQGLYAGDNRGFTISAWVNPDLATVGANGDIIFGDGHGGAGIVVFQADNGAGGSGFGFGVGGIGGFWNVGPTVINPGQWYFLEISRDLANNISLTVDGVDQGLADPGFGTVAWAPFASIGDQGTGGFGFDGQIDQVTYSVHSAIPEPSSAAILGIGFAGLLICRRRKK